jgi:hypothetical protein
MKKEETKKKNPVKYILHGNEKGIKETIARMSANGFDLFNSKSVKRYGKSYMRLEFAEPVKEDSND